MKEPISTTPWTVGDKMNDNSVAVEDADGCMVALVQPALFHTNGDEESRQEANSRLIAASPGLLVALQNAVRCGERDGMPGNPGSAPKWTIEARAAIARATGETHDHPAKLNHTPKMKG